jgi:uncharacterized cupin superfamily protein
MKPILNIKDLEFKSSPVPMPEDIKKKYEGATMGMVGQLLGAKKLGYNVTRLPPGKRAFPFHSHRVNEEMFFVLEGSGEIRIGAETFPISKGDFIATTPGGAEKAHQIVNNSDKDIEYLAVSTRLTPDIAEYPDSGKFGVLAEYVDEKGAPQMFRYLGKADRSLGYWDGE